MVSECRVWYLGVVEKQEVHDHGEFACGNCGLVCSMAVVGDDSVVSVFSSVVVGWLLGNVRWVALLVCKGVGEVCVTW